MLYLNSWAAGFFDGEGSISIYILNRNKRPDGFEIRVTIQASQQTKEPLEILQRLFGGAVMPYTNGRLSKIYYKWQLVGRDRTRAFLLSILPFAVVKREQVMKGLECIDLQCLPGNNTKYTPEQREAFKVLRADVMALNAVS